MIRLKGILYRGLPLVIALALLGWAALGETQDQAQDETQDAVELTAPGYVLVSTATQAGWLPLPEEGEQDYPLRQVLSDGTELLNVIHLTPEGVCVTEANCENHDCMNQGEVTLENLEERILGNMIVCLPNQVLIQLYTREQVQTMITEGTPAP